MRDARGRDAGVEGCDGAGEGRGFDFFLDSVVCRRKRGEGLEWISLSEKERGEEERD